jgi:hypothetical protein
MKQTFKGTYDDLQDVVEKTGLPGKWDSEGTKKTFLTLENGILNWWENTGTIQFQGKPAARATLEQAFNKVWKMSAVASNKKANEDGDDGPAHKSSVQDGSVPLLNLIKEALFEYGLSLFATGPSTCIFKERNSDALITLEQEGSVVHIRMQY